MPESPLRDGHALDGVDVLCAEHVLLRKHPAAYKGVPGVLLHEQHVPSVLVDRQGVDETTGLKLPHKPAVWHVLFTRPVLGRDVLLNKMRFGKMVLTEESVVYPRRPQFRVSTYQPEPGRKQRQPRVRLLQRPRGHGSVKRPV